MAKNFYKNLVFSEKSLDKESKVDDNSLQDMTKAEDKPFNPSINAYVPYFNEITGKYELFTVAIDPDSNRMELFRKELPHDNMNRAVMEMQSMYAADHVKKIMDEKHKRKGT